jgi:type IV pilus assembly protein PilM
MALTKIFGPIIHGLFSTSSTLGLEITDQAVKIVELKLRKNNRPMVGKMAMEKLPKQVVVDGRIKDMPSLLLTLQTLISRHNLKRRKIHMVVPSQAMTVRYLKLPDLPDEELRKIVEFEVKHNIHLPFDDPYFDFCKLNGVNNKKSAFKKVKRQKMNQQEPQEVLFMNEAAAASESSLDDLYKSVPPEIKSESSQCDVMLVAAPKEVVEEYRLLIQSVGMELISVEIKALSLFRLIRLSVFNDPQHTFLLVDINGHISELSIFHDQQLKITRTVPLEFREQAVQPQETELDLSLPGLTEGDTDFTNSSNELAHELERLINFYRYTLNHRNQEFDHIVVSGDVPRMDEIRAFLQERLSIKVIDLLPNALDYPENEYDPAAKALFTVPIGLALRGTT